MSEITAVEKELIDALAGLDEDRVYERIRALLSGGVPAERIMGYMNTGLKKVGSLFEDGEYFIADLMFAGMIYRAALDILLPPKEVSQGGKKGRILIGVVENDIHDIGKDIIVCLLSADNFDVIDLGIDVKPQTFVNAVLRYHPDILMLSGMMHFAQDSMQKTIAAIEQAGLRDQVFILLGGGCVDDAILQRIAADAAAVEPSDTLKWCNEFVSRRCR